MQERVQTISPEIIALIDRTLRESMAPFGYTGAEVRAGVDHDGDPVIFVEAQYDLTETPVDMRVAAITKLEVRSRLWDAGETRFPHVRHMIDDRQKLLLPRRRKR